MKVLKRSSASGPKNGPFQHAYNTTGSCWDWLAKNPEALDRFNTFTMKVLKRSSASGFLANQSQQEPVVL
jgi:hypothetical protein